MSGRELFLKYYQQAKDEDRNFLLENEAAEVCQSYALPLPECGFAQDKEQAVSIAQQLGYPVVMKVVSPQVIHKSDVEGVRVGLGRPEEVVEAYDAICASVKGHEPKAEIRGQIIAKMAGEGVETIVGLKRDEAFGPVVMFGIGGIFVEVYKDVSFRLCPVGDEEVEAMVNEVKGHKLLQGFRGMPKADMEALKKVILAVCSLGTENPEVSSIDLNPVRVNGEGALALDTRIITD
ncbi:acetate--CoA ligase family protein [Acidobacteria bacterium AH-259-D05]|nr:acetate--CoA ligase family protein [Acidobacteria bacterium AH-259-D05]